VEGDGDAAAAAELGVGAEELAESPGGVPPAAPTVAPPGSETTLSLCFGVPSCSIGASSSPSLSPSSAGVGIDFLSTSAAARTCTAEEVAADAPDGVEGAGGKE